LRPRSRHRYRPGRPVPSAEHAHVVPDVPPTMRGAVCEACGWGETPCQRHVSPRNPIRFETTVDTSAPAAISPHAAASRAGLNPGRHHVRANVDTTGTIASRTARRPCPWDNGWYTVQPRPCRRRPSGRAAITATRPLQIPDPLHPLLGPLARRSGTSDGEGHGQKSSGGVTQPPHLPHTQCICGCLVGPRPGVEARGVAGTARPYAAGPLGLALKYRLPATFNVGGDAR